MAKYKKLSFIDNDIPGSKVKTYYKWLDKDTGLLYDKKPKSINREKFNKRFKGTTTWFKGFGLSVLMVYFGTAFFGGFTDIIINNHTTTIDHPYGSSDYELSYFDYDITYKLNQLAKLRNVFDLNIANDDLDYQYLGVYDGAFTFYFNEGMIFWGYDEEYDKQGWELSENADSEAIRVYNYSMKITSLEVGFNQYYDYRNFYYEENDKLIHTALFDKILKKQSNDTLQSFALLFSIMFKYPFAIIYNVGYDLRVIGKFVFDW